MQFSRQIRHVFAGILVILALVGLSAAYWAVGGRGTLLQREDNPRVIEALARIQRGGIYDRHGQALALSAAANGGYERQYSRPSTFSVAGYYSLRYGVGGAEAAYDLALSGVAEIPTFTDIITRDLLRLPQVGSDIMLTLDADIQDALVAAMDGNWAAAVVLDAQNGDVLALASLPSYDPNSLDADWSQLIEAEGNPFFNRALQGQYQVGGSLYLLWLLDAIQNEFGITQQIEGGAAAIDLGEGMMINCVIAPPTSALSLADALAYSCPAAFDIYRRTGVATSYDPLTSRFDFATPAALPGFPFPEPIIIETSFAEADPDPAVLARRRALGQGELTTTPLHIAALMTAVVNDGLALPPRILLAQRGAGTREWSFQQRQPGLRQVMEAETAGRLRQALADAWLILIGQSAAPATEVGGFLAQSRSGDDIQLWLIGYAAPANRNPVVFVVLLENTRDVARIIAVGSALLQAL